MTQCPICGSQLIEQPDSPDGPQARAHYVYAVPRERFDYVGQESGSTDCGFFSGYVLSLNRRHNGQVNDMVISQQDVYRAREDFIGPTRNPTGPSTTWLHPGQTATYLERLGVAGYQNERAYVTQDNFHRIIGESLGRPNCYGVMIPCFQGTMGHWILVMGRADADRWVLYDSGPRPLGHVDGRPVYARILPPDRIAGYGRNAITSVIRPSSGS